MEGPDGNDIYCVDNSADAVLEDAGVSAGRDTVESSISYSLGANVENLTLTGSNALDGTGNNLSNILRGNGAGNRLSGGGGDESDRRRWFGHIDRRLRE